MIRHISTKLREKRNIIKYSLALIFAVILYMAFLTSAPKSFPKGTVFQISKNSGLKAVASRLKDQGFVKSSNLFIFYSIIFGGTKSIKAGEYNMETRDSAITLAWRLNHADFGFKQKKITIREGLNHFELTELLLKYFTKLDKNELLDLTSKFEGYLYPDTYFWPENITANNIITDMNSLFKKNTEKIKAEVEKQNINFDKIIKIASIVEKEAHKDEDRKLIAGILEKRLSINMPLQVDVTFYFIDPNREEKILIKDTKIDSPYNLYKNKGLPPTPICNPSINAILATINPTDSDYLYYLSDSDGVLHYAKTLDEHNENKYKYLR